MRTQFVLGLLVLVVAVVAAQKKKSHETAELPTGDRPMDGKTPYTGDRGTPPHHAQGGFSQGRKGHKKNPHHGSHPGKPYQDTNAIRAEIMRIKNSDIPEEEKAARLKAFREHVKAGGMMENMPEEARQRQQQLRATVQEIMANEELTDDEKRVQVAEAREAFAKDMKAIRGSLSPEQMAKIREEQKKTIEGHTAAAMAAKRVGHHEMARKYSRKAREAAQGGQRGGNQGRRGKMPSLSEPADF